MVERNLRDLTLRSFSVGDRPPSRDEQQYQDNVVRLADVSTFGDWILLLRYIVFYFEDRRSLVWDPSAQRQLLRILFLDSDQARYWTDQEREILEIDTRVRNMRAVATGEERNLASEDSRTLQESEIREELSKLEQSQRPATESLQQINSALSDIEARHEGARLRFLTLEQRRESKYRKLERAQLHAINARLPRHSDSARFIFAQLVTQAKCLACGNDVQSFVESIESRIRRDECVVCGSDVSPLSDHVQVNLADVDEMTRRGALDLDQIDVELNAARIELEYSEFERTEAIIQIQNLQTVIAEAAARVDFLVKQLPPEESQLRERHQGLASLRGRIEVLQRDLDEKRKGFTNIIAEANAAVERRASKVQSSFSEYAREFLLEDCKLVWSPTPTRLGQTGRRFDFPAFQLELGGSNFTGTVRRRGPDDVSESQREFIDLSFRMSLVRVATQGEVTSLVMDAPESSLDAVFVDRAARILGTFGRPAGGNRLILTLNLIAGNLIPNLLKQAVIKDDRKERVVDLLTIAAPTAALRDLRSEYEATRDLLLNQSDIAE